MRNTQQRRAILQQLRQTKSHPTAHELYELVRRQIPNISLGTVYRNLQRLATIGEIRVLRSGGQTRFDGETVPHDHVRCVRCGRVADAPAPQPSLTAPAEEHVEGFKIVGYRLEWLGICPTCAAQDRAATPTEELSPA